MRLITKTKLEFYENKIKELEHNLNYYKKNYEASEAKKEVDKATKKYNHIIGQWFENDECFFQVVRVGFKVNYSSSIRIFFDCYAPNWEDGFDMEIWEIEKLKPMTEKEKQKVFQ